ncbi:MAG TPA: glycosyltransferase family protein, partial [Bacteroidales bacterium]|nr:glycosyltransferase family protein [Bacteroidales bacterium]
LEWGLGHAARMIPVAKRLQSAGNNVFVGAGEKHLALFRPEPEINLIDFPGFSPTYSRFLPQYLAMLLRTPLLLYHIIREHQKLKKIIQKFKIDIVISDNRFGLWNKNITSVYFTHILRIPLPKLLKPLEGIGVLLHRAVINQYDHCFIPDLPGELNLSGKLSHNVKLPVNAGYAGILSRFMDTKESSDPLPAFQYDLVILSGPEPQRSILKKKIEKAAEKNETVTIFLEGRPEEMPSETRKGNFIYYTHLHAPFMKKLIMNSRKIISRSGYTTVMDLVATGKSALLIPTPGQTEQEYLARYLSEKCFFRTVDQDDIKILNVPVAMNNFTRSIPEESRILLDKALSELLKEGNK